MPHGFCKNPVSVSNSGESCNHGLLFDLQGKPFERSSRGGRHSYIYKQHYVSIIKRNKAIIIKIFNNQRILDMMEDIIVDEDILLSTFGK